MAYQSECDIAKGLVDRARELSTGLRSRADEIERLRQVPHDVIEAIKSAGLFRLYQPKRFGGHELPFGTTHLDIASALGAACASTAWVQSVMAIHGWIGGSFPLAAQEAVWGENPDALIATAFSPRDGKGSKATGGIVLDGSWEFSSGSNAADWIAVRVAIKEPEGAPKVTICLFPKSKAEIVDVWHAIGLRGTGSNEVKLSSVLVPDEHTIDFGNLRGGHNKSWMNSRLYELPYAILFAYAVAAPAVGVALGALEAFRAESAARPDRSGHFGRLNRYSLAAVEIESAYLLLEKVASGAAEALATDMPMMTPTATATARRNMAHSARLCLDAVGRLVEMLGAHGIAEGHPIRRAHRDLLAINSHFGLNWDSAAELFGRDAFGLKLPEGVA